MFRSWKSWNGRLQKIGEALQRGVLEGMRVTACDPDIMEEQMSLGAAELTRIARDVGRSYGQSRVRMAKIVRHVIDLDAAPTIPEGLSLHEADQLIGRVCGKLEWDPAKVRLHLDDGQKDGKWIEGHKLGKQLANEPVLPASLLDYLLKNPRLIPKEWKGKVVFFWGTIYRSQSGNLYVRLLFWKDGQWQEDLQYLGLAWYWNYPAALAR